MVFLRARACVCACVCAQCLCMQQWNATVFFASLRFTLDPFVLKGE